MNGKVAHAVGRHALAALRGRGDTQGAAAPGLARARRLALLALRNARAVDGELALMAAKDPDDEVRRLAMTAGRGRAPTSPPSPTPLARRCCAGE